MSSANDSSSARPILERWFEILAPQRLLLVGDESSTRFEIATELFERERGARAASLKDSRALLPPRFRGTLDHVELESFGLTGDMNSYDVGIFSEELEELPTGLAKSLVAQAQRCCRFLIFSFRSRTSIATDPSAWTGTEVRPSSILDKDVKDGVTMVLVRGGSDAQPRAATGRIYYLSPNRDMHGGVKILYNHVEILRELGMDAVLTVREPINFPASWFAWPPERMAFGDRASRRVGKRDTVVIPEFRFREVRKYPQAGQRLLFVQNPGLCFEIDQWKSMGYDGVLTLGCPDGSTSRMRAFMEERTDLPIFSITNHYSDDPWGHLSVPREPKRILCLPRKGREFVERLQREFTGIVTVDSLPQPLLAIEYARADIYVHTGFPEGQPMPPIEAMLSGCLVCGFTGEGGKDVMRDGSTAYVADDGDFDGLARALRRASDDPQREQVRAAGQSLCRSFTRAVTASELAECYRQWAPSLPRKRAGLWRHLAGSWHRLRSE